MVRHPDMVIIKSKLLQKTLRKGIEALKEVSSSVSETINNLTGGIKAGLGYLGAENLDILKKQARFVRVTPAGQRESIHDVIQVKSNEF